MQKKFSLEKTLMLEKIGGGRRRGRQRMRGLDGITDSMDVRTHVSCISCIQSFPASGFFPVSQFFASGGQSIAVSASTSVLPMNTHDLISFRMEWLDLLSVQGTLKSLLPHHSSKASILPHSAFFIVQLSHPYMTTGKTIACMKHKLESRFPREISITSDMQMTPPLWQKAKKN